MAKKIDRLTALKVKQLKKPGWYPDGRGLYLQVSPTITRSWVYRYKTQGKERRLGLGTFPTVTLEAARAAAEDYRKLRLERIDPFNHKRQLEAAMRLEAAKGMTFKECSLAYIEANKAGWKNRKHESQWRNTLDTYAFPVIAELSIQDVDTGMVMKVIEPIWYTKTETASRVRQRIEKILDWATVREYRVGENPARWRGHIENLLPKRTKVQKVKHHNAMPYAELPDYFRNLRTVETVASKCLAFTILTATRATEARDARWTEIDIEAQVWTIPPERMKAGREHRIPLSSEALKILKEIEGYDEVFLFPGLKANTTLSEATIRKLLRKTHDGMTVHGFRSSFRDWVAELTAYPREIAEAALAHTLSNATEAAYQRGDMFVKRERLMAAWAKYCTTKRATASTVTTLKREA